ncbi:hypothetical protein AB0K16_14600 [Nonomuraea jabiensis]|uniref:Prenyltransferase n=1 Tax=Nonomuraea jabiensis TaxID=882448 RepID=A0A7W9G6V1_9ACTN|nr:hypothetical protein [Nonomuraea jabiensis]MBB5778263.1 hypothetical protein [Nonomuraea jabiensis]
MNVNLSAIPGFLAGHARVLDRRRYDLLMGDGDAASALGALEAYRNPDGGYGWGLEPDLRTPESQPGAALHAFEVFADAGPVTSPRAAELCDWLDSVTLADGGVPFSLPLTVGEATAPWWAGGDADTSSLQITSISAAAAHRVAAHDPAVAAHPWLERATRYCLDAIQELDQAPHAYVLAFAVRFLDAVYDTQPRAAGLLKRLAAHIPADGRVPVEGGTENETLRPLDFAPHPGPARDLFEPDVIAADLVRLAGQQKDDGGWDVDYARISPAGALDWRGAVTVNNLALLRENGLV